jgi:hypothetical protein
MKRYSRDLTNVKPGDIRSVRFSTGVEHPIHNKYVPAVITHVHTGYDGNHIQARTLNPVHWPADPQGYITYDGNGYPKFSHRPPFDAVWEGWVETKGHIRDISFPIKAWVSRYKDGHLVLTFHEPTKQGIYWEDPQGITIPLPKTYYPEVTFKSGPKEVTYVQSI